MASLIHIYRLLFICLMNAKSSEKFPSLFYLPVTAITFSVLQLNVTGHILVSRGPHSNWQHVQLTPFSSEGLCFIKLRLVEIQIEYHCHWNYSCKCAVIEDGLHYSPLISWNSLLDLTSFDYNMAPTRQKLCVLVLEWFQLHLRSLAHLIFLWSLFSHRLTHSQIKAIKHNNRHIKLPVIWSTITLRYTLIYSSIVQQNGF